MLKIYTYVSTSCVICCWTYVDDTCADTCVVQIHVWYGIFLCELGAFRMHVETVYLLVQIESFQCCWKRNSFENDNGGILSSAKHVQLGSICSRTEGEDKYFSNVHLCFLVPSTDISAKQCWSYLVGFIVDLFARKLEHFFLMFGRVFWIVIPYLRVYKPHLDF
jgi:hypothetical protein